ncbi:glycoside hydrolase family 3 protein [Candidatus Dojkabacteria bacterium]|nr:glycoside hydrolase family 3 protein [Candidatus Dojkabacteria bacterium]
MKPKFLNVLKFVIPFFLLLAFGTIVYTGLTSPNISNVLPLPKYNDDPITISNFSNHFNSHFDEINLLTYEERIGQLLIISIEGTTLTQDTINLLNAVKPGGVILFKSNIMTMSQTQKLTADLQTWAANAGLPPLIIAVDEEGGIVERITFSPAQYSQEELGNINTPNTTIANAQSIADNLKLLGINTNFAPVADIAFLENSIIQKRSFGADPQKVASHVGVTIDTYNQNNILSTAKHFPGHGRTTTDSHLLLPTIDISKQTWLSSDAIPFITAIEHDVPFIMIGHLLYPQIDSKMASLSEVWMEDILRGELGFKGLIISDDIKMGAVGLSIDEAGLQMLGNGCDILVTALSKNQTIALKNYLIANLNTLVSSQELNQRLIRILEQKEDLK